MRRPHRDTIFAAGALMACAGLTTAARADEYDEALRCLTLIEIAKMNPTADNIDSLREAGDKTVAWADRTRPGDLTDQQKIDRLNAAIADVQSTGGLAGNEDAFYDCTAAIEVFVVLPGPAQ